MIDAAVENDGTSEYPLYHLSSLSSQPLQVTLEVEKQSITMEIGTGASVSIMSKEEHQKRWPNVNLEAAEVRLCTYTGECLEVLGKRNVTVCYGQQTA